MSPLYLYNGKLLVVDGKLVADSNCCCTGCCERCVIYKYDALNDLGCPDPFPFCRPPETIKFTADTVTHDELQDCFDVEFIPSPSGENDPPGTVIRSPECIGNTLNPGMLSDSSCDNSSSPNNSGLNSKSYYPCVRILCDQQNNYKLQVCMFFTCTGAPGLEFAMGRSTIREYEISLDDDGCPISVGEMIQSTGVDYVSGNIGFGIGGWFPKSKLSYLDHISLDDPNYCNQDCWNEWPYDFFIGERINGNCVSNSGACCTCLIQNDSIGQANTFDAENDAQNLVTNNNQLAGQVSNNLQNNGWQCIDIEPSSYFQNQDGNYQVDLVDMSATCCGDVDENAEPIYGQFYPCIPDGTSNRTCVDNLTRSQCQEICGAQFFGGEKCVSSSECPNPLP